MAILTPTPSLAVAIPCRNRPRHLATVLAVLRSQWPGDGPLPVVCCDDASDPPLASTMTPPAGVQCLRLSEPRGPAAARNAAWRSVPADWIWFLDDDVLPEGGAVSAMFAAVAAADPRVGMIEGPVRAEAGAADQLANPLVPRVPLGGESHRLTANIVYRRSALERVGGFDEGFPAAACEDFDLAFRVEDAGWLHAFAPLAAVRHAIHRPERPSAWLRRRRAGRAAVVRLYSQHPNRFGPAWMDRYGALIHQRGRVPDAGSYFRFFVAEAFFEAVAARRWWRRPHYLLLHWILAVRLIGAVVRDRMTGALRSRAVAAHVHP